ncbi:hypothetical protein HTZ77_21950 [Nonomuraea sp. SMC257]|uniref:Lipoprotein n=1 Tax=Nonomuraea montanisoli TaxID=2741721 RepID=A0A7Y6I9P7_9ACTN|nr:hypothetical protein [Nonomuraea montanisoli]NUW34076.1 hypothetical protein [Nonomuraea montanisoli]
MSVTVLRVVSLGLTALLSATGCAGTSPARRPVQAAPTTHRPKADRRQDSARVELCVKKVSLVRATYQPCDDATPGYAWYYVPASVRWAAVGKKVAHGTWVEPATIPLRVRGDDGTFLDDRQRVRICVRKRTRVRVADDRCRDAVDHAWYYLLLSRQVPAVGGRAAGGSFHLPRSSEWFRGRRSGGKGGVVALRPRDDTVEADPTPSGRPSTHPSTHPSTRPSTRPSDRLSGRPAIRTTVPVPTARTCTTTRTGKVTVRRCS